jgi:hypothetical protein
VAPGIRRYAIRSSHLIAPLLTQEYKRVGAGGLIRAGRGPELGWPSRDAPGVRPEDESRLPKIILRAVDIPDFGPYGVHGPSAASSAAGATSRLTERSASMLAR